MGRKKLELEYVIPSSPTILFQYISTPSGLVEWFCDDVNIKKGKDYTFIWDGEATQAELIKKINGKLIQFKWEHGEEDEYFQMEVTQDELTEDIGLLVEDWVEEEDFEEMTLVWNSQIDQLKQSLGIS